MIGKPGAITLQTSVESIVNRFNVSRESREKLEAYAEVLKKWQKRINLIAESTVEHIWQRHIADGLQLLALIPANTRVLVDVGSGAGIPGMVLAIVLPETSNVCVHLVESNGKKAAFLKEAARVTGATACVHRCRIEDMDPSAFGGGVDIVTARAVAPLAELLKLTEPLLKNGAKGLFYKGQDVDSELTEATKYWRINFKRLPSQTDSRGCILDIREIERVTCL